MLTIHIAVSDCKTGFPDTSAIKRIRINKVGSFEDSLNKAIEEFDSFADRLCTSHVFSEFKDTIIEAMASLANEWDMVAVSVSEVEGDRHYQHIISVTAQDKL